MKELRTSRHGSIEAWKYRVLLILEEHDLENYVKEEVAKLEGDQDKVKQKTNMVKSKRIIVESIKEHFIPHVSSFNTPKEMFDVLTLPRMELYPAWNCAPTGTLPRLELCPA